MYDPGQFNYDINTRFQQRHGRQATADEQNQFKSAMGGYDFTSPATQQQYDQAMSLVDSYQPPQGQGQTQQTQGQTQQQAPPPITQSQPSGIFQPPPQGLSTQGQALSDTFYTRLQQELGPVTLDPANNPALKAQIDLRNVAAQRNIERRRAAHAERMGAQGMGETGAFDVGVDQIVADEGLQQAGFEADLMGRELIAQRDRIQHALQLGAGVLSAEQSRNLQERLSLIDLHLRNQSLGLQERFGLGDLDLRRQGLALQDRLGTGDLNLRRLLGTGQLGLGLASLLQGGSQFNDRLAFDYTALQDLMDRNALTTLLGGL